MGAVTKKPSDCLHNIMVHVRDEHPPPHVHVLKSDGRDCIVEIDSLLVIGKIASREIREAMKWIDGQRQFLLSEWRRYNP